MKKLESSSGDSDKSTPQNIVERTFDFAVVVIQLCVKLDERPGVGRILMSQILRARTSGPANVGEGQAAPSKAGFVGQKSIARKEARETHLRFRLLVPANVISINDLNSLIEEADEIKRIIGAIIVSTKRGMEA